MHEKHPQSGPSLSARKPGEMRAPLVVDEMFVVAAKAVAEQVGQDSLDVGLIYPPQSKILTASLHVAARIAEHIFDHGLARIARPEDISRLIDDKAYVPAYGRVD